MVKLILISLLTLIAVDNSALAQRRPVTEMFTPTEIKGLENLIASGGIGALLDELAKNSEKRLSLIHLEPYCEKLSQADRDRCLQASTFGENISKGLYKYQNSLKKMPIDQFSDAIRKLAMLRDRLLDEIGLGNLILADQVERIIFWRLVERTITAPIQDVDKLDELVGFAPNITTDWKSLAQALGQEYDVKLNLPSIAEQGKLSKKYDKLLRDLESRLKISTDDFPRPSKVEDILKKGNLDWFLWNFINETRSTEQEQLKFFITLRKKMKTFPENRGEYTVVHKLEDGDTVKTLSCQKILEGAVRKHIPEALNTEMTESGGKLYPSDFYQLFELGSDLDNPNAKLRVLDY